MYALSNDIVISAIVYSNLSLLCFDLIHLYSFLGKIKIIKSSKSQQRLKKSTSFWFISFMYTTENKKYMYSYFGSNCIWNARQKKYILIKIIMQISHALLFISNVYTMRNIQFAKSLKNQFYFHQVIWFEKNITSFFARLTVNLGYKIHRIRGKKIFALILNHPRFDLIIHCTYHYY